MTAGGPCGQTERRDVTRERTPCRNDQEHGHKELLSARAGRWMADDHQYLPSKPANAPWMSVLPAESIFVSEPGELMTVGQD